MEQQKRSKAQRNQPPAIPPRPGDPTTFLQQSTAPQINLERVLGVHQGQTEMQNRPISQQEHNPAGTENHVCNSSTQAHDTLVFNSATDDTRYAAINPHSQACHPAASKQPRSLSKTVKQTNTIC